MNSDPTTFSCELLATVMQGLLHLLGLVKGIYLILTCGELQVIISLLLYH
jgi:hypothetical protein